VSPSSVTGSSSWPYSKYCREESKEIQNGKLWATGKKGICEDDKELCEGIVEWQVALEKIVLSMHNNLKDLWPPRNV